MNRRRFLASSIAASSLPAATSLAASHGEKQIESGRDYYLLRRYYLRGGPQGGLCHEYFSGALIPAANRLGVKPVGVFNLMAGPQTPSIYVLLPSDSLETLIRLDHLLEQDKDYIRKASPFLDAPAGAPAFERMESSLMIAFHGQPQITPPPGAADHHPRMFELRTYESPSERDHRRKIEMFHSGEFDVFARAGFHPVFYGDMLVGPRKPQLTYMLSFPSLEERNKLWKAFGSDPEWTRLTHDPRFDFEPIVTNITNLFLEPADSSQI